MNKKNLAKKVLGTLAILASIAFLSSPANAGCTRNDKEDPIRNKYNDLVSFAPGQYNSIQAIPIGVETYFNGGLISQEWAKKELKKISIRAAKFLAQNNFDPSKDELIGGIMTFSCYERPLYPLSRTKIYGPNIFVPYIAIRRSGTAKNYISSPNFMIQANGTPVVAVFENRKESFALGCPEIRNVWSRSKVRVVDSQEFNRVLKNNPVVADLHCDGRIPVYAPTNEPAALLIKYRNGEYYRHYLDDHDFISALKSGNMIRISSFEFRRRFTNRGSDFKAFR